MKLLRLVLVFVLSLTIPLAASSAAIMEITVSNCPMQGETGISATENHDCCDTNKSKPSSPCKSGQTCKICSASYLSVPSTVSLPSVPSVTQMVAVERNTFIPSHSPAGLWRPPRFL
jgi:hypothetical protein